MSSDAISPLRRRMIEDMSARKLNPHTQRSHIASCKRFAAYLKRSPDTATADEIRLFQLQLTETGTSICNRNRIMTGLRFLFRVTLRRSDLAAEARLSSRGRFPARSGLLSDNTHYPCSCQTKGRFGTVRAMIRCTCS